MVNARRFTWMYWLPNQRENKAELELTEEESNDSGTLTSYYQKREELEEENQTLKKKRQDLKLKWLKTKGSNGLTGLISDLERKLALSKLESEQVALNQQRHKPVLATLEDKRKDLQGKG